MITGRDLLTLTDQNEHQDIRFKVQYQKGVKNQTDVMSRNARPLSQLSNEEQNEADDISNILYTLHTTPIIDHIGLSTIAEHTTSDSILKDLREIIKEGKTWIPKDSSPKLYKFEEILPEITVTGNGIRLKGERIILPEALQDAAIRLAHSGSHPGKSGMERRLRYHFFFHNMNMKVDQFVKGCNDCQLFTDKRQLSQNGHTVYHPDVGRKLQLIFLGQCRPGTMQW